MGAIAAISIPGVIMTMAPEPHPVNLATECEACGGPLSRAENGKCRYCQGLVPRASDAVWLTFLSNLREGSSY